MARLHITLIVNTSALSDALGEAAKAVRAYGRAMRTAQRRQCAAAIRLQNQQRTT